MIDLKEENAKKSSTPIICVHFGNQEYLHIALKQAKKYNPNSRIILIGDETNKNCLDFVEHYNREDLNSSKIEEFKKVYNHLSPNDKWYETACIERWFLINELCKKDGNISRMVCIDSDILLFCDVTKESERLKNFDYTLSIISGHTCYINSPDVLENMTDFFLDVYKQPIPLSLLKAHYYINKNKGIQEGISDMYLLCQYAHFIGLDKVGFIEQPIGDSVYDFNFQYKSKKYKYKLIDDVMYRINKKNGDRIRINNLHFQGLSKKYMMQAYKNGVVAQIDPYKLLKKQKKTILFKVKREIKYFLQKIIRKVLTNEI